MNIIPIIEVIEEGEHITKQTELYKIRKHKEKRATKIIALFLNKCC